MKICKICRKEKSLTLFYNKKGTHDGLDIYCKECKAQKHRDYQQKHKEELNEYIKKYYKSKPDKRTKRNKYTKKYAEKNKRQTWSRKLQHSHGITVDVYEQMVTKQNNICAICHNAETVISRKTKKALKLCVDHNHNTGEIRGLLCTSCNLSLGHVEKAIRRNTLTSILLYLNPTLVNKILS